MVLLLIALPVQAGQFHKLGIPVKSVMVMGSEVGVDETGREVIYFNCSQAGSKLFLLQVDPQSGRSRQFNAPMGEGAWAMIIAPDKCVYLGTWESGYLLKFDPRQPEKGLVSLGKPSATETYIWHLTLGADGWLYGCTYPHARLVRYNPATGKSEDLARLDEHEMYARSIASSTNGSVYIGIGTVHAQVARYNPTTGKVTPLLADNERPLGNATVSQVNDQVYARIGAKTFRIEGDTLTEVAGSPAQPLPVLHDGRSITNDRPENGNIVYTLISTNGATEDKHVPFDSVGTAIFTVAAGPSGRIYGSSVLPLEIFDCNPADKKLRDLGPTTGAEVYSFATDGKLLYSCAYPRGFLSIYDPKKPWHFGPTHNDNPRGFGYMGDGHLRPRAMIIGPDKRIYVGSLPPYGEVGGALGIYDPKADAVTENYRNIVTNQGISALCYEPVTKKIFGGSDIAAGGGGQTVAKECVLFGWNPKTKRKDWESVIIPGDHGMVALTAAHGKLFGVSYPSETIFVLGPKTHEVLHQEKSPLGRVQEISLAYYAPHDCLYGLTQKSIFKINPDTYAITEVARSPDPITCGFAVTESGIYFGSRTQVMQWEW